MKNHVSVILTIAIAMAAGCTPSINMDSGAGSAAPSEAAASNPGDRYLPGVAEVLFSEPVEDAATKASAMRPGLEELGIVSMERIFPDAGEMEPLHRKAGLDRWYRVRYNPAVSRTKAEAGLKSVPGVEAVNSPVRRKRCANFFNDPFLPEQWNLINNGGTGFKRPGDFTKGCDINVLPVWQNYTTGSKDIVVAVVDDGVSSRVTDLAGVVLPAGENGSRSFMTADRKDPFVITPGDHGTHVAGIIAGINNDGKGICGVAGGNDGTGGVRIMSCQIFKGEDDADADAEAAIVWAADHGAVIANNSWGYDYETEGLAKQAMEAFSRSKSALKDAINYFNEHAGCDANGVQTGPMKGGVLFFSAGNESWAYSVPAGYDGVVAVAAHGPKNNIAEFSNYGNWVDICAPGGAGEYPDEWVLSICPDGYYDMAGTSQACPHVAGVAALLLSYYGGPGFTRQELIDRLIWGAAFDKIKEEPGKNVGGRLDAYGAFQYSSGGMSIVTDYAGDYNFKSHEQVSIDFRVTGNAGNRYTPVFSSEGEGITAEISGNDIKVNIDALAMDPGTYPSEIAVAKGQAGEVVRKFSVTIQENHVPVVAAPVPDTAAGYSSSASVPVGNAFTDEDGEKLALKAVSANPAVVTVSLSSGNLRISPKSYGSTTVTVTASDARGASCSSTFNVVVYRDKDNLGNPISFEMYPNPVTDVLFVRSAQSGQVNVKIYNKAGILILETAGRSSVFNPLKVDMTGIAAGIYNASVSDGTLSGEQTIVKL